MARHFVIAGAGYTGSRLARALFQHGKVTVIARRNDALQGLDEGIHRIVADLDTAAATRFARPATVIYLAPPPAAGTDDPTIETFLAHCGALRRLVYLSTSGVYGDCDGEQVTEQRTPAPRTARARRRLAAEMSLGEWSQRHGCDTVILRVSGIYGPGRLPLQRIRRREPVLKESDSGPGNRIHVDDLVRSCLLAATADTPPPVVNISDGNYLSSSGFTRLVAQLAGLPLPPEISLQQARNAFTPMRWSFLAESRRLDITVMREQLGVDLEYPDPAEGIRASLQKQ